jgi:hypothetical protein
VQIVDARRCRARACRGRASLTSIHSALAGS